MPNVPHYELNTVKLPRWHITSWTQLKYPNGGFHVFVFTLHVGLLIYFISISIYVLIYSTLSLWLFFFLFSERNDIPCCSHCVPFLWVSFLCAELNGCISCRLFLVGSEEQLWTQRASERAQRCACWRPRPEPAAPAGHVILRCS